MILGECSVANFGSYSDLTFNFNNLGPTILCGPTGCGKSTLIDIPLWILYGQTTKQTSADQVIKWDGLGQTSGAISVATEQGEIAVYRSRSPNDLFWREQGEGGGLGEPIRGKDLTETQKLLSKRLGVDYEGFVASCFYHEFSPAATFFTDKAKDRRDFFEHMANLDLPRRIDIGAKTKSTRLRGILKAGQQSLDRLHGVHEQASRSFATTKQAAQVWYAKHQAQIKEIQRLSDNFQIEKENKIKDLQKRSSAWNDSHQQSLEALADKALDLDGVLVPTEDFDIRLMELEQNAPKCDKCGAPDSHTAELRERVIQEKADNERVRDRLASVKAQYSRESNAPNPHLGALQAAQQSQNVYGVMLEQEKAKANPHSAAAQEAELNRIQLDIETAKVELAALEAQLDRLDQVLEISQELKITILTSTIKEIETDTNRLLDTHFDGEFQVIISVKEDDLGVIIMKDTHECSFRQLSRGQKQLLRLCFSVASMKVAATRTGVTPQAMFFDEALDGLSTDLKIKAESIFRHLSATTVLVVEHSPEIQNLFDNRITVSLIDGASCLTLE